MGIKDDIYHQRYKAHGEKTWEKDSSLRIGRTAAQAEAPDLQDEWTQRFHQSIASYDFIPGGRIIVNAGKPKPYMMNCNVISVDDSRESIGEMLKDILVISGTGGGVGVSFSKIRPKGAPIQTNGGESSGTISFMHCADQVAGTIKTGGGRRAALMMSLSVYHPDILDFLHEKLDLDKLKNANISVEIDDKFIEAVNANADWDLIWAGKVYKTVKAREIWDILVSNALESGEPGILNIGHIREMANSSYFTQIETTNPCGELPLPAYSACCLGSINVANFAREKYLDVKGFKQAIETGVRFLDDIITVNEYPLERIKLNATSDRRIGLGIMGLHYAMLKLGIKYSSDEGVAFVEKVYEILRNHSYWTSAQIASEKGSFSRFDREKFLSMPFVKSLPSKIRDEIRDKGMRNVCLNTQAPTGTTSLFAGTSSGIEPIFAPVYERKYQSDGVDKTEIIADEMFVLAKKEGRDTAHFEASHDISPEAHLKVQEAAQRYIDSAISKTINLPRDFKQGELSDLMLKYIPGLKGVTIYKEGAKADQPLTPLDQSAYENRTVDAEDIGKRAGCTADKCDL